MPDRMLILFSYYIQAGHCLLGAVHMWVGFGTNSFFAGLFNGIFAGINCLCFINAANWRRSMLDHIRRLEPNRRIWKRD